MSLMSHLGKRLIHEDGRQVGSRGGFIESSPREHTLRPGIVFDARTQSVSRSVASTNPAMPELQSVRHLGASARRCHRAGKISTRIDFLHAC